jgi:hypothetical protein
VRLKRRSKVKSKLISIALVVLSFQTFAADYSTTDSLFKDILKESELESGKDNFQKYLQSDFTSLWNSRSQNYSLGFIGSDYQRLKIHFKKIIKSPNANQSYFVSGCSFVKDKCDFEGSLIVNKVISKKGPYRGCDAEKSVTLEKGLIIGSYNFKEDYKQNNSGVFNGTFFIHFIKMKNGKILYDTLDECSDGFWNTWFVGTWKSNSSGKLKQCTWGDYRIPMSGDLDVGAGEFYPNPKYYDFGWRAYGEAQKNNDTLFWKKEQLPWW